METEDVYQLLFKTVALRGLILPVIFFHLKSMTPKKASPKIPVFILEVPNCRLTNITETTMENTKQSSV